MIGDLVVAMADRPTVRAHAFRFARPALTRDLLAGGGDLVARRTGVARPNRIGGSEIAVRIAELIAALSSPDPAVLLAAVRVEARDPADKEGFLPPLTLGAAIAAGQVRKIAGNRLDREDLSGGTVRVIGPDELTGALSPGARGVDRLVFSAKYVAGRYTEPGDVVFCTSPRPAALVDAEGGSVVVAPAQILRITPASAPGLLPDVLAADINAVPTEARAWRGWTVRQVSTTERVALAEVLTTVQGQRTHALDRVALLDELTQLVMRGVTSGSLTLTAGIDSVKGH